MTAGMLSAFLSAVAAAGAITTSNNLVAITLASSSVVTARFSYGQLKGRSLSNLTDDVIGTATALLLGERTEVLVDPLSITAPLPIADFLKGMTPKQDLTTPNFWTPKRAGQSSIIVGARGLGKSVITAYQFQQSLTLKNTRSLLCDPHFDAVDHDGNPLGCDWLPGVDREEVRRRYLISMEELLDYLLDTEASIAAGREGEAVREAEICFCDEWDGIIRYWKKHHPLRWESGLRAIDVIFDEGRKFKKNLKLVTHSLKKARTELDSSVVAQCDLFIVGANTYGDASEQLPTDINRKAISQQRQEIAKKLDIPARAVGYRDCITGEAAIIVAPDLSTPVKFKLEIPDDPMAWLDQNKTAIDKMIAQGKSKTAIADALSIQRILTGEKADPRYVVLTDYLSAVQAVKQHTVSVN
jgi:hypothetical protein